jgi:hypothetical protein
MPHGDTCVSHLFEPGAIPASAGMTPILPTMEEPPDDTYDPATLTYALDFSKFYDSFYLDGCQ